MDSHLFRVLNFDYRVAKTNKHVATLFTKVKKTHPEQDIYKQSNFVVVLPANKLFQVE